MRFKLGTYRCNRFERYCDTNRGDLLRAKVLGVRFFINNDLRRPALTIFLRSDSLAISPCNRAFLSAVSFARSSSIRIVSRWAPTSAQSAAAASALFLAATASLCRAIEHNSSTKQHAHEGKLGHVISCVIPGTTMVASN